MDHQWGQLTNYGGISGIVGDDAHATWPAADLTWLKSSLLMHLKHENALHWIESSSKAEWEGLDNVIIESNLWGLTAH